MNKLYVNRKLAQGYPALRELASEKYIAVLDAREERLSDHDFYIENLLVRISRLVDLGKIKNVLVIGCGPRPQLVETLIRKDYDAVGIEPVISFVRSARDYLGSSERIL